MADYDRVEQREVRESPFHTLAKQVAGLNASNDETAPHEEAEDEAKVVDVIESLCINCEENVRSPRPQSSFVFPYSNQPNREKHACF